MLSRRPSASESAYCPNRKWPSWLWPPDSMRASMSQNRSCPSLPSDVDHAKTTSVMTTTLSYRSGCCDSTSSSYMYGLWPRLLILLTTRTICACCVWTRCVCCAERGTLTTECQRDAELPSMLLLLLLLMLLGGCFGSTSWQSARFAGADVVAALLNNTSVRCVAMHNTFVQRAKVDRVCRIASHTIRLACWRNAERMWIVIVPARQQTLWPVLCRVKPSGVCCVCCVSGWGLFLRSRAWRWLGIRFSVRVAGIARRVVWCCFDT